MNQNTNGSQNTNGKPGPFQIIEALGSGDVEAPMDPPRRRYDCLNYEKCLELAAALNWDNFTCRGCNSTISEALLWRAHQALRKDQVAGTICEHLPEIGVHGSIAPTKKVTQIVKPDTDEPAVIDRKA